MLNPLELQLSQVGVIHKTIISTLLKIDRSRVSAYIEDAYVRHDDCRVVEALLADAANKQTLKAFINWLAEHSSPLLDMDIDYVVTIFGGMKPEFGLGLKVADVVSFANAYAGGSGKVRDLVRALQGDDEVMNELADNISAYLAVNVHEGTITELCGHCGQANIYEGDVRSEVTMCRHCSGINLRSVT